MRTGDLEPLLEKRAMNVMEAQSQFPGHIVEAGGARAAAGGCSDDGVGHQVAAAGKRVRDMLE